MEVSVLGTKVVLCPLLRAHCFSLWPHHQPSWCSGQEEQWLGDTVWAGSSSLHLSPLPLDVSFAWLLLGFSLTSLLGYYKLSAKSECLLMLVCLSLIWDVLLWQPVLQNCETVILFSTTWYFSIQHNTTLCIKISLKNLYKKCHIKVGCLIKNGEAFPQDRRRWCSCYVNITT